MPTLAEFLVRADEFIPPGNTLENPIAREQGRSVSRLRDDSASVRATPGRAAETAFPTTANT
ncbi:hypothetical protein [Natrialba asiatica]|uniref:Uncharacterized protein n=1 Tax=Natrialba asiatica (strain ATCC 700177 / DSM 12278 / JCM 9576 / FERM P-10747 / NBRC 102637 / 172P1) TaxID=29540 RepID=M0AUX6_NATA1|nr:hypothetical protein [Natrialba asiatica]ELZ02491.1 hypothetical protein C481_07471 [Natrialba asiatica DSM 12278]